MTPPPAWPYSALKPFVSTVNSVNDFNRRCIQRGFRRVRRAVCANGVAVESRIPSGRLTAAERQLLSAALRLGRYRHQVEGAPHRAGDHERQFVHKLVLHLRRDFRVIGLDDHR